MAIIMVPKEKATLRTSAWNKPDAQSKVGERPRQIYDYFGRSSGREVGPEGFVGEVFNGTLRVHFHPVDQFQILLGEEGSFYQRHPVSKLMLHYADAFATYGPMFGTDPPLRFFTLRETPSTGLYYMPDDRNHLEYRGRRHYHVPVEQLSTENDLAAGASRTEMIIDTDEDGLEAVLISAGPNSHVSIEPSSHAPIGQYVYVADGSADIDGELCGPESLGWQRPEDGPVQAQAGADGVRILVLRFPYPATPVAHAAREKESASI